MKKVLAMEDLENNNSQVNYDAYQNHQVFELIDKMMDYYDGLSYSSFFFMPHGTLIIGNYATYIYMSIQSTLSSIKTLLKMGHISDAFVLIRKLFDIVLVDIYIDVVREDNYDWMKSMVVKEVDEWLRKQRWMPRTDKILNVLKESKTTRDLYPLLGWDTYLKTNRGHLDNHVHASSFRSLLLNCETICVNNREKELKNASIVLKQIMMVHLAFMFYMNGPYMMDSTYMDYHDCDEEPPEGSEKWLASYAQKAFDEFLKPYTKLATFIKEHCPMELK